LRSPPRLKAAGTVLSGHRADARHLLQQRDVLGVVDLVEQRLLLLGHVHADDEQVFLGKRHVVSSGSIHVPSPARGRGQVRG
jgi:hypothetical protein